MHSIAAADRKRPSSLLSQFLLFSSDQLLCACFPSFFSPSSCTRARAISDQTYERTTLREKKGIGEIALCKKALIGLREKESFFFLFALKQRTLSSRRIYMRFPIDNFVQIHSLLDKKSIAKTIAFRPRCFPLLYSS